MPRRPDPPPQRALVSLSGGMDSATVLGEAVATGVPVETVGFVYGSKHNPFENDCARKLAEFYQVPFRLIDLTAVMSHFKSALMTSSPDDIPEGHYEAENMKQTVVPNRNMIFLSILTGIAASEQFTQIWMGMHAGDHAVYCDCRPGFVNFMQQAIRVATAWTDDDPWIILKVPFLYETKKEILERGLALTPPVPYEYTRTCYKAQTIACGRCGACQERIESWRKIGKDDPIEYESRTLIRKKN